MRGAPHISVTDLIFSYIRYEYFDFFQLYVLTTTKYGTI